MRNILIVILIVFAAITANAGGLSQNPDGTYTLSGENISIIKLVKQYGKLKRVNIYIASEVDSHHTYPVSFYGNKIIEAEDLDRYIISLASSKELTVIRSKDKKELSLIKTRSARMENLPLYAKIDEVPKTKEFISYFFKLKNLSPKQVERTVRPLLSRGGRVVSEINSKGIIIRDYAIHIHFLNQLIYEVDRPMVSTLIAQQKELNQELKEMAKITPPIEKRIEKHLYLFIGLFSLIFLILGFMVRGFVIRRIEGGL